MAFRKITEESSLYNNLEKLPTRTLLEDINKEDRKVADAVYKCIPQIEKLVDEICIRMKKGGRVFYIGAGTSGRLGVLDASEIPPTFGMDEKHFIGLIAGGERALRHPVENAEDDINKGWEELNKYNISSIDTLIGIAASGTTPYVVGALKQAGENGILTASISSNPGSPASKVAQIAIEVILGPEFVTGSSRMKSGTAQKMILNMISTATMIKLGRVKDNKMINMQLTNKKLILRGTRMLMDECSLDEACARDMLLRYGSVSKAMKAINNKKEE
jgi:Predicted sugar phosphate isomerase